MTAVSSLRSRRFSASHGRAMLNSGCRGSGRSANDNSVSEAAGDHHVFLVHPAVICALPRENGLTFVAALRTRTALQSTYAALSPIQTFKASGNGRAKGGGGARGVCDGKARRVSVSHEPLPRIALLPSADPARRREEGLAKGRSKLDQALGLGQTPSVIPDGDVDISGEPRRVEVGWHPVAGLAGKWFAEQTGLGKMITEGISKFPDPTQHWAVLVGDYCHQLWMVR